MLVNALQPWNAPAAMLVTVFGIEIEVTLLKSRKALAAIDVPPVTVMFLSADGTYPLCAVAELAPKM